MPSTAWYACTIKYPAFDASAQVDRKYGQAFVSTWQRLNFKSALLNSNNIQDRVNLEMLCHVRSSVLFRPDQ
jgi:hypothetical protein